MKIPVRKEGISTANVEGITEAQFNQVLDRVERIFREDISRAGGTLRLNRRWSDPTVNASAQQFGSSWIVNMYGGLARHKAINVEGFALVACHELGHHIGGAPKVEGWFGTEWATNEGGADYYANLKCLRRFFAEDDNRAALAGRDVDPWAEAKCREQFADDGDRLICLRNSLAGQSVSYLFQDLRSEEKKPTFASPDKSEVDRMNDNHPDTQCRMDTYIAGALCSVRVDVGVSDNDFRAGSCVQGQDQIGWRPRCWFKEPSRLHDRRVNRPNSGIDIMAGESSPILW